VQFAKPKYKWKNNIKGNEGGSVKTQLS